MTRSRRQPSPALGLTLSPDVLALNPHVLDALAPKLARPEAAPERAGRSRRASQAEPVADLLDGRLVLNGRRVRSQTEARAYAAIPLLFPGAIDIVYEAFSCQLGSVRYTWDFTFRDTWDGDTVALEVKPERWDIHPSGRSALRSIKQASSFYGAHFTFVGLLLQSGGAWRVQTFRDGEIAEDVIRTV